MKNKPPKCAICKSPYKQWRSTQKVCSTACAIALVERDNKKKSMARKRKDRAASDALKPLGYYRKKMISSFNAYVRERDKDKPCISCGRHHKKVYHSGHYLTTKARPWLSVHPANAHKQCYSCNVPLSGNIVKYRKRLIKKIGVEMVEYLENSHSSYSFTVEDMKEITAHYRDLTKILKMED